MERGFREFRSFGPPSQRPGQFRSSLADADADLPEPGAPPAADTWTSRKSRMIGCRASTSSAGTRAISALTAPPHASRQGRSPTADAHRVRSTQQGTVMAVEADWWCQARLSGNHAEKSGRAGEPAQRPGRVIARTINCRGLHAGVASRVRVRHLGIGLEAQRRLRYHRANQIPSDRP